MEEKNNSLILGVLLVMFLILPTLIMANPGSGSMDIASNLNLYNQFFWLNNIYSPKGIEQKRLKIQYGKGLYSPRPQPDTLSISFQEKSTKKHFASLKSSTIDTMGMPYSLNFLILRGWSFDRRYSKSLELTSNLFYQTRDEVIQRVFTKELCKNNQIQNITPIYISEPNGNINGIQGYRFNYVITPPLHYLRNRTAIEIFSACGIGVANYYLQKFNNMDDWKYKYTFHDMGQKIKDGWYWDPNDFNTNTLFHLYAGYSYYQIARSNDYGIPESLAWTFGGSLVWEFFGEWREQVSLNDMIFTPMLGAVMGECMLEVCKYIRKSSMPNFLKETLTLIIAPTSWLNQKIDSHKSGSIKVQLLFKGPVMSSLESKLSRESAFFSHSPK